MTRPPIPSRDEVLTALAQLQADGHNTGRQPAVLALARRLGLANTTFRRNFPDIAAEARPPGRSTGRPAEDQPLRPAPGASARLRQDNRQLREQLQLATAVIQRITWKTSNSASNSKPLPRSPQSRPRQYAHGAPMMASFSGVPEDRGVPGGRIKIDPHPSQNRSQLRMKRLCSAR
jgi:hypothetical protein